LHRRRNARLLFKCILLGIFSKLTSLCCIALTNPHRLFAGAWNLRLYGTNKDNPPHPVWCPERSPVDMMLFQPLFYIPEAQGIGMSVSFGHLLGVPILYSSIPINGPADFLCEDQD
jgi:hypothetical protein